MAKYSIEDSTLTGIADAIREKAGTSDTIAVSAMADAIAAIVVGSAGKKAVCGTFTGSGTNSQTLTGLSIKPERVIALLNGSTSVASTVVAVRYDPDQGTAPVVSYLDGSSALSSNTRKTITLGDDSITFPSGVAMYRGTYTYIVVGE